MSISGQLLESKVFSNQWIAHNKLEGGGGGGVHI